MGKNFIENARVSLEGMRAKARWYHGGYALYVAFSFVYFHDALPLIGEAGLPTEVGALFLAAFLLAKSVGFLGGAVASLRRTRSVPPVFLAVVAALLLILGVTLSTAVLRLPFFAFGSAESAALLGLAAVLLGMGDSLLLLLWGRFCSTLSVRTTYLFVLLSYVAALVAYGAMMALPAVALMALAWLGFGVMPLCLQRSLAQTKADYQRPVRGLAARAAGALWRPVVLTALFALLSSFTLLVSGQQSTGAESAQFTSTAVTLLMVLLLLVPALFSSRAMDVGAAYRIALPVSTGGFLLLAFLWNGGGGVANSMVAMGWLIADIISWCMIADAVRKTDMSAFLLFGLCEAVIGLASLAGVGAGFFFATHIGTEIVTLLVLALIVVYLCSMVVLLVMKDRRMGTLSVGEGTGQEGAGEGANGAPAGADAALGVAAGTLSSANANEADGTGQAPVVEDRAQRACDRLAAEARLTPRETDVLRCLAQGRNTQYMADHLCISENTVKSHVRKVYQKLGVNSKQEVIDMVNSDEV